MGDEPGVVNEIIEKILNEDDENRIVEKNFMDSFTKRTSTTMEEDPKNDLLQLYSNQEGSQNRHLDNNNEPISQSNAVSLDDYAYVPANEPQKNEINTLIDQFNNLKLKEDWSKILPTLHKILKGKSNILKIGHYIYEKMESKQLEISRKYDTDCLLKKAKSNFSNCMLDSIKNLKEKYSIPGKLKKLSQNHITKINIEYEFQYLLKPLFQFFLEEDQNIENQNIMRQLLEQANSSDREFLSLAIYEHYEIYLTSKSYRNLLENLKENPKHDENYLKLFSEYSQNYLNYFFTYAHNDERKKK